MIVVRLNICQTFIYNAILKIFSFLLYYYAKSIIININSTTVKLFMGYSDLGVAFNEFKSR